jgi:hypothetical protein
MIREISDHVFSALLPLIFLEEIPDQTPGTVLYTVYLTRAAALENIGPVCGIPEMQHPYETATAPSIVVVIVMHSWPPGLILYIAKITASTVDLS